MGEPVIGAGIGSGLELGKTSGLAVREGAGDEAEGSNDWDPGVAVGVEDVQPDSARPRPSAEIAPSVLPTTTPHLFVSRLLLSGPVGPYLHTVGVARRIRYLIEDSDPELVPGHCAR